MKTMKTMVMKYRKILIVIALSLSVHMAIHSQHYTEDRRIVRTYECSHFTTVEVTNKYGKIHVIPWNKDSVKFTVDLHITSSTIPRLKKTRDNIDFDFTATSYFITANTVFGSKYNTFFSDIKNFTETFLPSDNEVIIDYTIMVPKKIILKINNKYGDVYLDDLDGEISLSLANGDLKANKLFGNINIGIAFGDGNINYMNEGKISISYSDLRVREANQIFLESKSSNVTIDKTKLLKTNSKRDKLYIGEVETLLGNTYFSDIKVSIMQKDINYSMKYGNIFVQNVQQLFSLINITSEYTDIEIFFQRGASYHLDITHTPDVYMNLPKENADIKKKIVNEETKELLTYGQIGKKETESKLKLAAMKKCNITIMHK